MRRTLSRPLAAAALALVGCAPGDPGGAARLGASVPDDRVLLAREAIAERLDQDPAVARFLARRERARLVREAVGRLRERVHVELVGERPPPPRRKPPAPRAVAVKTLLQAANDETLD